MQAKEPIFMASTSHSHVDVADRWVTHGDRRLFVRVWTDSPTPANGLAPIVLLHDSLGCVELWRDFPARLAAGTKRTVIAYDRLGFGRSDRRTDVLTPAFVADEAGTCFAAVREQLGFGKFVVFGHSIGGAMAIHCAARFPEDCEALVTESAQVFLEETTLEGIRAAKALFADAEQFGRLEKYHGGKAKWVLDAWTGTWLSPQFASWSLAGVLARVGAPALAIHGSDDEYGTTRHPRMMAEWSGAAVRVEILPEVHHLPHREQPDQVVRLVRDFLGAEQAT
jgi:pimeloyl-ACP methyl ester carboxylesterase